MMEQMAENRHWTSRENELGPLVKGWVEPEDRVEMEKFDSPYTPNDSKISEIREEMGIYEKGWARTQWREVKAEYSTKDMVGSSGELMWCHQSNYLMILSPTFVRFKDFSVRVKDYNNVMIYRNEDTMECTHRGRHFLYSIKIRPFHNMMSILKFKYTT